MNTQHISGAVAIKALREDFDMLLEGTWVPDEDSIEASIEMLDHIEAERAELLKELTVLLSDRWQPAYYTLAEWRTKHPTARAVIANATGGKI